MVQIRDVTAVALVILVVVGSSSAFPFKPFGGFRQSLPLKLSINAPVSGADIAFSRAQAMHPLLNPGIVYMNDPYAAVNPDFGYPQDAQGQVVLNKPGLDNVNIGAHPGPDYY